MDILPLTIQSLSREEMRAFKLFANRMERNKERRDLMLFDHIKNAGEDYDEEVAFNKIYPDNSRNTFHRLKSRLLIEVSKSQFLLNLDSNEMVRLHHLLAMAEIYKEKDLPEMVNYFLRKAELKAIALKKYEFLEIIYNEFVSLSSRLVNINPEEYIRKRKESQAILTRLRTIEDVLATINYRLRISQNFAGRENKVIEVLQEALHAFEGGVELEENPVFRIRLFEVTSRILVEQRDFVGLEDFLKETYLEFVQKDWFDKQNHAQKLQMLAFLINSLYKNGKYKVSLNYADELKKAMEEFDRSHYERYLIFYYNSLVINYYRLDVDKAIEILEEMKKMPAISDSEFHSVFVHLNLAMSWYIKQNYKQSIRNLVRIYLEGGYKSAASGLKLRIGVAELLIRYKLNDYEIIISRLRQIKRDFESELKQEEFERENALIQLVGKLNESLEPTTDKKLLTRAKAFLKMKTPDDSQEELIDYNDFVRESCGLQQG
ncbi:MAG: hypothetical protein H6581_26470 [Bacteroidia bacterium]|nr:hypothetical protein [Bacteroidia bacterium]